jgi:uncharacterized protein YbjT (DUF2867 family)
MNQNNQKTAILVGGTGLVGSHLLQLLLESNIYSKVILFSKRSSKINHPKIEEYLIDFDKIHEFNHLIVGDDFFCTIGTTIKKAGSQNAFKRVDLEYPLQFAQISKINNFKCFLIVSSIGADPNSGNFYLKVKGELETRIKNLNIFSTYIFRPSLLLGKRTEFRFGEKVAMKLMPFLSFLLIGKLRKYRPIKAEVVAKSMFDFAQINEPGFRVVESNEINCL